MPGGERAHAHYMHVVINSVPCSLSRSLEQRPYVNVKAHVGIRGGDYLGAPVMPVLAHLSYHYARTAALSLFKLIGHLAHMLYLRRVGGFL